MSQTQEFLSLAYFVGDVEIWSMEYDWIGENFYFTGGGPVITLCNNKGECADVHTVPAPISRIYKVALDPPSR